MTWLVQNRAKAEVLQNDVIGNDVTSGGGVEEYVKRMNEVVASKSADSAVVFLYMPCLPDDSKQYDGYLGVSTNKFFLCSILFCVR